MTGNYKQGILIIDDSPLMAAALSQILSPSYDVKIAYDGEAGIEIARSGGVDLILLDVVLPGRSGFEILAALKQSERTWRIPVIFITGNNSSEDEATGLSLGAVDYIRKPFNDAIVTLRVRLHMQLISQMRVIERFGLMDGLTGLDNRRSFDASFKTEWERAVNENGVISMLLLDIDYFKRFNDQYGHMNGDTCLKRVADTLRKCMEPQSDSVFRWGGEEFVVILPGISHQAAMEKAEYIRRSIENTPIRFEDKAAQVTASIGLSTVSPTSLDDAKVFFDQLDDALYRAKENGRNRIETT
ncbi:MAG: diguanylate cyclase [Oscillospiraceae bacterium]|nr:diguanylate cyclase [Oscillospiraceae bacterium]